MNKLRVIPNSIDLDFYKNAKDISKRKTIAFISSADCGLHRMIEIFQEVKKRVPWATLHVFYEWKKLYEKQSGYQTFNGLRLRYINTLLEEMGTEGQSGLYLHLVYPVRLNYQQLYSYLNNFLFLWRYLILFDC